MIGQEDSIGQRTSIFPSTKLLHLRHITNSIAWYWLGTLVLYAEILAVPVVLHRLHKLKAIVSLAVFVGPALQLSPLQPTSCTILYEQRRPLCVIYGLQIRPSIKENNLYSSLNAAQAPAPSS